MWRPLSGDGAPCIGLPPSEITIRRHWWLKGDSQLKGGIRLRGGTWLTGWHLAEGSMQLKGWHVAKGKGYD